MVNKLKSGISGFWESFKPFACSSFTSSSRFKLSVGLSDTCRLGSLSFTISVFGTVTGSFRMVFAPVPNWMSTDFSSILTSYKFKFKSPFWSALVNTWIGLTAIFNKIKNKF